MPVNWGWLIVVSIIANLIVLFFLRGKKSTDEIVKILFLYSVTYSIILFFLLRWTNGFNF